MLRRFLLILAGLLAGPAAFAQTAGNGIVHVRPLGRAGAYTGFAVSDADSEVARVLFSSGGALTARSAKAGRLSLRFEGLAASPTPALGPASFVEVRLLPGSSYPEVRFQLDLRAFDRPAWEKRFGKVPFHFLTCSLPGAEVFHQRGWSIGTPVVDPYIMPLAQGPGRTIVSNWSRDWTYAPPIGAYPMAVAGLWNPSRRRYVAYDFSGARLTDHSEKEFGTSYCTRCAGNHEFFCLTWPYGRGYINLRYPTAPVRIGTHFRLLWSRRIGPDDDPNRFVQEFLWKTYARLLPAAERMNDLSWLPTPFRINGFAAPGPLGDFTHNTGAGGERFWAPNVNVIGGVSYFSPVDYYYETRDQADIEKLARECRRILPLGKWMEVDGDRCFFWQTPLDGGGAKMFGPGVETFHHVNGWYAGMALLDYYRNDPAGAADLLPYIDGVLRWTKHILYTRNGYPDVPAAQFAWSATPCATFCWRYYYRFRNDPERKESAALAAKLAQNMTYRYLAIWPCDNDESDDLDSSFFMEPNAGLPWLGSACANEVWVYNIAMLYEYVATGDPIMGHYLRGMLERYHQMFQDQWNPSVADYGMSFTERFGLFDECPQGKGTRGDYGGLWGGFERLIWPIGTARARVVCGEKAAMAFDRDGRHTDIADYRYYGDGSFSFRLVPIGRPVSASPFDLAVTFPFFDLRGRPVSAPCVSYPAEPSTLLLKGVKLGDMVVVGRPGETTARADDTVPVLPCSVVNARTETPAPLPAGFRAIPLGRLANAVIRRDWADVKSYAGYEPGLKTLYGVPFLLLDPDENGGRAAVSGKAIPLTGRPQCLFALVGDAGKGAELLVRRSGGRTERVDLSAAVPAVCGWPPVLGWHLDLVMVNGPAQALLPKGCRVFAVTECSRRPAELAGTVAALKAKRAEIAAQKAAVAKIATLAPLFERLSGHVAVLPTPTMTNPRGSALVKQLTQAGLARHLVLLSKEDLVNPAVFNTGRIWIAFYVGGEDYYQTVSRPGDGEEAMLHWLKGGGTLVSFGEGPFPFYYNEKNSPAGGAAKFGLPVCGSGAGGRLDKIAAARAAGWEKVPAGLKLSFRAAPGQKVLPGLPAAIPWPAAEDPRWRPVVNVVGPGNVYTPLVTLRDQKGQSYGDAAALIEYRTGPLAGAHVCYLWSSLRRSKPYGQALEIGLLRTVLSHTLKPVGEYACVRAVRPPAIDGKLDDPVWQQAPATEAFTRFGDGRGKGRTLKTTAKLAWDERALYVAWECEDPDVWSPFTKHDSPLWEQDAVEIYVDADGSGKDYREIEISPRGAVADLSIAHAQNGNPVGGDFAWNAPGLQSAVQVDGTLNNRKDHDRRWTAEAAIPWDAFPNAAHRPPKIGDTWRVQLLRIDRSKGLPAEQIEAWSATDAFHRPERFGRLTFGGNPAAEHFSDYAEEAAPTPTWAVAAGEWHVQDGVLVGRNSGTDGFTPLGVSAGDPAWRDYRLKLRFQVRRRGGDHRDGAWIGFRYGGAGQCYSLNVGLALQLCKAAGGRSTGDTDLLATAPWANDTAWHALAIAVQGRRITVALDGRQVMDATDNDALGAPVPAGGICLSARKWTNSPGDTEVAFDDVEVEKL